MDTLPVRSGDRRSGTFGAPAEEVVVAGKSSIWVQVRVVPEFEEVTGYGRTG